MTLAQLDDALVRNDVPGALDHALAVWSEVRGDALAAVVTSLYDRLPVRAVISGANNAKRWLAVEAAADPRDIPRQLAYLYGDERMRIAAMCISALVKRPSNPVLARGLAIAIVKLPWRAPASADIYHEAIIAIATAGTKSELQFLSAMAERLAEIANAKLRDQLNQWITQAITQLRDRPQPTLDLSATYAALEHQAHHELRHAALTQQLLAAVYANLDDNGPRLVLADHLAQAGDPRGELIALQCQPTKLTAKQSARARKLVEQHGLAWLAELGEDTVIKDGLGYERGFWVRARLRLWRTRTTIIGHPLWTTLREAELLAGSAITALLHPVCVSLRALYGVDTNALVEIRDAQHALPLELIGVDNGVHLAALAEAKSRLPKLRELCVHGRISPSPLEALIDRLPLDRLRVSGATMDSTWRALVGANLRELELEHDAFRFVYDRDRPELLQIDVLGKELVAAQPFDFSGIERIVLRAPRAGDAEALAARYGVTVELQ